jgi:hypothetical protein
VGVTVVLPVTATVPILLLIEAEAALADVQVSVALDPAVTVVGEAANVTVGGGAVGVAAEDPHPFNNPVVKVKATNNHN